MRIEARHEAQGDVGDTDDTANDAEITRLLGELELHNSASPTPPPTAPPFRTPHRSSSSESAPPPYLVGHASPLIARPRNHASVGPAPVTPTRSSTYSYRSPSTQGVTRDWAVAGYATQGVAGVHIVSHRSSPNSKKKKKSVAYVVFCGLRCGVFHTWDETDALVSGVPNCIFRGFPSLAAVQAAFDYAEARLWTRDLSSNYPTPIAALPQPISAVTASNALSVSETEDDLWYVVYRGIYPGVYRSQYV
ncbi:hypothetical protein B0H14DRAFT_3469099 [Mycena olivaceomarginata]|nr:hypothetical protein B0H14DRAFT_3469099 [Mycena olivaceomarginata]